MARDSPIREDNRLDDVPMIPVPCRTCGAQVLARKSSWNQTSVQWTADATSRCAERHDAEQISVPGSRGIFLACSALSESIADAVRCGSLPIVDETVCATP
ncbi:ferredoxin [Mycobacterium sp. 1081908.1]|nr:ferredoxin [Mycobacterium sp. 1081908.1]